MAHDLNQVLVAEQVAFEKHRRGDVEFVIAEQVDDLVRRIGRLRQLFGQGLANGRDVLNQLLQDVVHQGLFLKRQDAAGIVHQIADGGNKAGAPLTGLVTGEIDQHADVGGDQ